MPLVIHFLVPLITYSLPLSVAVVVMLATSDPALNFKINNERPSGIGRIGPTRAL